MRAAPSWLGELQARFGEMLRTPLDRTSGTLVSTPDRYAPALVVDCRHRSDRLEIYNRQYWFRLFETLLDAFPLTASLLGAWRFHEHSDRFLRVSPPRGWDLERVDEGFAELFIRSLEDGPERHMLTESARIDDAWLRIFRAPSTPPFQLSAADAARLLDARLVPSAAVALLEEHAPLVALRQTISRAPAHGRVAMPAPLDGPRWWAIARTDLGTRHLPLERQEYELLRLLVDHTVRDALTRLERESAPDQRLQLPARTQAWLARGITHGFWSGLRD